MNHNFIHYLYLWINSINWFLFHNYSPLRCEASRIYTELIFTLFMFTADYPQQYARLVSRVEHKVWWKHQGFPIHKRHSACGALPTSCPSCARRNSVQCFPPLIVELCVITYTTSHLHDFVLDYDIRSTCRRRESKTSSTSPKFTRPSAPHQGPHTDCLAMCAHGEKRWKFCTKSRYYLLNTQNIGTLERFIFVILYNTHTRGTSTYMYYI